MEEEAKRKKLIHKVTAGVVAIALALGAAWFVEVMKPHHHRAANTTTPTSNITNNCTPSIPAATGAEVGSITINCVINEHGIH